MNQILAETPITDALHRHILRADQHPLESMVQLLELSRELERALKKLLETCPELWNEASFIDARFEACRILKHDVHNEFLGNGRR
jgi:hypothetical protein